MKRRFLFMVMAMFLLTGLSKTMAQASNVDLKGIWQMCFYVSGDPTIPGELKPSNSFKILTDDGKFINMVMIPNKGAIIIGSGSEYLYGLIVELLGRYRIYAIESPSYKKIEQVYKATEITYDLLPLTSSGINSEALAETKADVLHTTPYRSYPSQ